MRVGDPVCKMEMEDKWVKYKSECQGKTYYFCCESFKKQFDENPNKFI
jgi:YHS domain-containing protein